MFEYSRETSWAVDQVRFEYRGGTYRGRGRLTWNPDRGFHLDAFLDRHGPALPNTIEFGKLRVVARSELRSIRMCLEGFGRAISPQLVLGDQWELVRDRLDIEFPSILFSRPCRQGAQSKKHYGSALFEVGKGLVFPDRLDRQLRVNENLIKQTLSRGGIAYEDEALKLRAWQESEGQLRMEWVLTANAWSKTDAWKYAEGIEAALSFLGGRTVRLLERRTRRRSREYVERRKQPQPVYLGILSLPPRETRRPDQIEKEKFIELARFFTCCDKEASVARHICAQMAEASRQETRAAQELLCSTILEAALRTIDGRPFMLGDYSWKIKDSLERFRVKYLSVDWKETCQHVLEVRERLRHRNAHPDWLTAEGGGLSDTDLGRSLDDMIHLSWFYGYMVFALAGIKDLERKFPTAHTEWPPLLTYTSESMT